MLHAASELLDVPEDELFLNDSHILRVGQDEPLLSFAELAKKSMHTHAGNLTAYASYSNVTNPGVTGAHFAHVEVDTWTGFTKVLDYLAVHDIGQAINPGLCEAQIQGAVQMGCGAALREKMTMQKDGPLHGEFVQISSVPCKRSAEHPRGAFAGRTLEGGPVRREIHRRGLLCAGRSGGVRRGERRAAREPLGAAV